MAISKSSVELSTIASKEALFEFTWQLSSSAFTVGKTFGWFLTTNSTLPTQNNYDPYNDPSVAMYFQLKTTNVADTFSSALFIQRDIGSATLSSRDVGCNPAGSVYIGCFNIVTSHSVTNSLGIDEYTFLNFTGAGSATSPCSASIGGGLLTGLSGAGCSFQVHSDNFGISTNATSIKVLPPLNFQSQQYYIGVFASVNLFPSATDGVLWYFDDTASNLGTGNIAGLPTTKVMAIYTFLPATGSSIVPPLDTGGYFGPVIKALVNLGVFILNALLGFVAFIAPALQTALNFLESQIITLLNLIGNTLGFGNIGSDLSTFLNNMITFFTNGTYGLPAFFGFFGTYFTNFLRWLQIDFQFIGPIFSIANSILIFGVNGIAEAITIMTIGLQMLLFGYGTFIVFAYFMYVGDDGIGGLFTFLGTLEAISFKILNSIVIVTNLGLDFLIMMISLIPKPFIQMTATRVPRLPTIESNATMSFPTLDFGEARNGNLIVYWLWCMGLWFVAWFESQNPSLPGSIGMLDPAVAANVRQLSAYIPLLQAATLISGGLVVIWFSMLPLRLAGIDVTEAPFGASLGRRAGPGPSSVHISGGKKHLIGPAKKAEQLRQAAKGEQIKKEEKARTAIETRKKELEDKKRSEELRKKELARKPSGKDLRGPNLQ